MKVLDLASFEDNVALVKSSTIPASSCDIPSAFVVPSIAFLISAMIFDLPLPIINE
jgi:hypothetical protein